jgi:hypothetical protein
LIFLPESLKPQTGKYSLVHTLGRLSAQALSTTSDATTSDVDEVFGLLTQAVNSMAKQIALIFFISFSLLKTTARYLSILLKSTHSIMPL